MVGILRQSERGLKHRISISGVGLWIALTGFIITPVELLADAVETFTPQSSMHSKTDRSSDAEPSPRTDLALPMIFYGEAGLPDSVAATREALISAATSGEITELESALRRSGSFPMVQSTPVDDPVAYWKSISFDGTGRDVLAQILKILRSGYVHVDAGKPSEMFIWPYHAVYPIDRLTPQQQVELYVIMPPREVMEMDPAEGYGGYRIGVATDGTVRYFKTSD
ncbi:hypothetical protein FHS85_001374 [Rhodoligotrophos appendicifer]|uniref:hypothetical protein n=1 Tax=Rhodoligotrophos appendicifer TaxID=987056 RepID=UPI001186C89B|nr:hypothetical protein [Rhodoligotrophos appendicifer]